MTESCVFLAANDVRRVVARFAQPEIGRRRLRLLARQEAARPCPCSINDAGMRAAGTRSGISRESG